MDFTQFVRRESVSALTWLGKQDWLDFGYSPDFSQKTVWTRPKALDIPAQEKSKYPQEHWDQVAHILQLANKDVINSFLALALSKAIAGGPKVFRPTFEDCEALENTACTMAFEDYKQPYPVVIVEFPKEYKQRLAKMWALPQGPSHVIVHHEPTKGFINVNAWWDRNNVVSHIAPARPEYKTIEDAIAVNRDLFADIRQKGDDFEAAELAQRLAVNFCMVMVLLGVRQTGPLETDHYKKAEKLAKSSDPKKRAMGTKLMESAMYEVKFIQQKVKLYEEEYIQPRKPYEPTEDESHRTSPKPHWRRGHYRNQAFGNKLSQRKLVFIKPVLVRSELFVGDQKDTQVTYTLAYKKE